MIVDALEVMVKWLAGRLTAVSGRVANKHRYRDGWAIGLKAASVHPDEMDTELYAQVHNARVEVRLYGTPAEISDLFNDLDALCRNSNRNTVVTSKGTALMQFCNLSSGLSTVYDDELKVDVGIVYLFAMISHKAI